MYIKILDLKGLSDLGNHPHVLHYFLREGPLRRLYIGSKTETRDPKTETSQL